MTAILHDIVVVEICPSVRPPPIETRLMGCETLLIVVTTHSTKSFTKVVIFNKLADYITLASLLSRNNLCPNETVLIECSYICM